VWLGSKYLLRLEKLPLLLIQPPPLYRVNLLALLKVRLPLLLFLLLLLSLRLCGAQWIAPPQQLRLYCAARRRR
jgi:hypothetical protein